MLTCGSLFSGVGLLDYGLHLAGLRHAWFCEVQSERRIILGRRWPGARVLDDVRAVGPDAVPRVDVIAGGFPCKGASTAGKRAGFGHPETVLWREMARAVGELRPRYVLVENVANILVLHDGAVWGEVLGDLASLGFDVAWDCVPAAAFGAPHLRDRVIAVATYSAGEDERPVEPPRFRSHRRTGTGGGDQPAADATGLRCGEAFEGLRARQSYSSGAGAVAAPDTGGDGLREQSEPEPRRSGASVVERTGEAAADAAGQRRAARESTAERSGLWPSARAARGVAVEWGEYGPAIRRWEAAHGVAPEPLVRRVDDGRAVRVERSRLSALGDGVHVYLGQLAGAHIVDLERQRLMRAAA